MSTPTADLYDRLGESIQSLPVRFSSFGGTDAFDGPIQTVRCFEDNVLLRRMLGTAGNGRVLVVDGAGSLNRALLGDNIAQLAADHDWSGLVINGAIRDRVAISRLPIGIKALGTNPRKSTKDGTGETEVVLDFGGVTFRPGAHLYSDEDGILVER